MTLIETLILVFIGWNVFGFIGFYCIPYIRDVPLFAYIFTPKGIYDHINVNWFGAIVLTLVFNLICPVLSISWWFCWLCTIGRK